MSTFFGVLITIVLMIVVLRLVGRIRKLEERLRRVEDWASIVGSKSVENASSVRTESGRTEPPEGKASSGVFAEEGALPGPGKVEAVSLVLPPALRKPEQKSDPEASLAENPDANLAESPVTVMAEAEAEVKPWEVSSSGDGPSAGVLWLDKVGLMPPRADDESANAMAWWSTRVGLAFGVISAVFLGMYVNQDTVPWVRLLELVLVAVAVFAGGCWFERKLAGFGRALSAGGLALFFVAAYASYGLPAMKVIESPWMGVGVQILALLLTAAWALWKGREAIFGLALVLGYVTCWFAAVEGVEPVPLAALLVLSVTGSALFALRNWWSGLWGAVVGSGLGLAVLAVLMWGRVAGPSLWVAQGAMLLLAILPLLALCYRWSRGEVRAKKVVPMVTAIALFSGAVVTGVRGFDFEVFYASFAALLFLVGWWWRRDDGEGLWQTLWAKAMVLLALLLVSHFDGPVRAFSLLGQAFGLLWLARTRSRVVFEVGTTLAALVGWFLLWNDLGVAARVAPPVEGWGLRWPLLAYLVGAQVLMVSYRKFVGEDSVRRFVTSFVAVLIALEVVEVTFWDEENLWLMMAPLAFGLVALLQRWPLRLKDTEWTAFVVLIFTLVALLEKGLVSGEGGAQALVWLVGGCGFYAWLGRSQKPRHVLGSFVMLVAALFAVALVAGDFFEERWFPLVFVGVAGLWHVVGSLLRYPYLCGGALLAAAVSIYQIGQGQWQEGDGFAVVATLLLSVLWWLWGWRHPVGSPSDDPAELVVEGGRTVMLAFALWAVLEVFCDGFVYPIATMLLSSLLLIAWRLTRGQSLSWLSLALAVFALGKLGGFVEQQGYPWVVGLFFVLLVANGVWLARMPGSSLLARPKVASVLWGTSALGIVFVGLGMRAEIASWTTACWVFATVAVLVTGFCTGLRGYRFLALAGLAMTIVRLFLVDIQDSFWRIVAFGITGVLLVGIGYLYNRFHKRLGAGDLDWGERPETGAGEIGG